MSAGTDCPLCGAVLRVEANYCDKCGSPAKLEPPSQPIDSINGHDFEMLQRIRVEKDHLFKHHSQSPIPEEIREKFNGLSYFSANSSYRFLCKLNKYCNPARVRMMTSTGENRDYFRVGFIRFIVERKIQTLQAYKAAQEHQHEGERETLFIPFRDATSGKESYGAGRYLEIEETENGLFLADFNRAHNPYCAYSEKFSCPFPPTENWLGVEIKSGEKIFKD